MFIPFLLTSCAEEKLTGRTGESVSFSADIAEDSNDLDYIWTLVEQPDASLVNVIHFHFNEVRSTASFIPDKPGSYEMEVKVFQYGDELALQTFQIQVEQGENVPLPPPPTTEPDWYEKESDRQWFEEPVEEINEIPEITEVAPAIDNIVEVVKEAEIEKLNGETIEAFTYCADNIAEGLKPYLWYKYHVLLGAVENDLPPDYILFIDSQFDALHDKHLKIQLMHLK